MDELVQKVLKGEKGAATRFYHEYAPRIRRYLNAKLPDGDREEVLQDIFLSAFDCLALYRGDSSVSTWLIAIARHEIADYYRKKYVRQKIEQTTPLFENIVSEILSPEFCLEKKKAEKKFNAAYKKLSKQYQDILCFRFELSMSVKEIAKRMDLSFKATESLLYRARLAFRAEYERG